jgi:hypothetical protein
MTNTTTTPTNESPTKLLAQLEVKTIDVNAKEWFDRINGNSYFSATVSINYGMDNSTSIYLPFQYGYGDHYTDMAAKELDKLGYITLEKYNNGGSERLWQYCNTHKIILRQSKQENCKKRDL